MHLPMGNPGCGPVRHHLSHVFNFELFLFSTNEEPSKLGTPEDSNNSKNESEDNERTSSNNVESVVTENTPSTKPKGKRLKIVEVDGDNETETSQNLNGESNINETALNKPSNDIVQQPEVTEINRTVDSDNDLLSTVKPQLEKPPELPALVLKGQSEGTQLFKLGRYAEAAEQFTQAIDILKKGKEGKNLYFKTQKSEGVNCDHYFQR